MSFKKVLHRSREQDQQHESMVTSDAASQSKSLIGAASKSENSTPPSITLSTNGHQQRRTTAARTTKIDLNKPLPPLPTTRPDTQTSDVDSNSNNNSRGSEMSTKAASALSSPSYASSTTLLSNDVHYLHKSSDPSIAAILEKLTAGDREIIIRALNSVRLDPMNNPIAPSNQRETAGLEGRSSLCPSPAIDKEEGEKNTKTKRRWLKPWTWKSRGDGENRSKGGINSARDAAPSAPSSSHCISSPKMGLDESERMGSGSNLPIGGSGTAARLLRNTAQVTRERSRQTQKGVLEEQALRQIHARTKGQKRTQTQTLGTRALKTRERSSKAMDTVSGVEMNLLFPLLSAPAL